jgi:hypothetical protein
MAVSVPHSRLMRMWPGSLANTRPSSPGQGRWNDYLRNIGFYFCDNSSSSRAMTR